MLTRPQILFSISTLRYCKHRCVGTQTLTKSQDFLSFQVKIKRVFAQDEERPWKEADMLYIQERHV